MSGEAGAEGGGEGGVGGLLLNQPVVIDNGSSSLKAGFAGGSKPKASGQEDSNFVGLPRSTCGLVRPWMSGFKLTELLISFIF